MTWQTGDLALAVIAFAGPETIRCSRRDFEHYDRILKPEQHFKSADIEDNLMFLGVPLVPDDAIEEGKFRCEYKSGRSIDFNIVEDAVKRHPPWEMHGGDPAA